MWQVCASVCGMNRALSTAAVMLTASVLTLTGCTSSEGSGGSPSGSAKATVAAAPTQPAVGNDVGQKKFGESYTFADKVAVSVSAPEPYTPATKPETEFPAYKVVTVNVTNGNVVALSTFNLTFSAKAGDKEATQLFDAGAQILATSRDIEPGKDATWKVLFGAPDDGTLMVSVANLNDATHTATFK